MQEGDKYYTMFPYDAMLPFTCYNKEDVESIKDEDIFKEWTYGQCSVFDGLAAKRRKIYTSKEECIKDAWERISHLLEVEE